jgi:hypothetical protein
MKKAAKRVAKLPNTKTAQLVKKVGTTLGTLFTASTGFKAREARKA